MISACLNCEVRFEPKRNTKGKYCSNRCQQDYQYKKFIERWKNGKEIGNVGVTYQLSNHIRRYMLTKTNNSCEHCGWDEKHPIDDLPLVEVDHIDGNPSNTIEDNLRVLCPNCHAKTDTHKARNKNSPRKR